MEWAPRPCALLGSTGQGAVPPRRIGSRLDGLALGHSAVGKYLGIGVAGIDICVQVRHSRRPGEARSGIRCSLGSKPLSSTGLEFLDCRNNLKPPLALGGLSGNDRSGPFRGSASRELVYSIVSYGIWSSVVLSLGDRALLLHLTYCEKTHSRNSCRQHSCCSSRTSPCLSGPGQVTLPPVSVRMHPYISPTIAFTWPSRHSGQAG